MRHEKKYDMIFTTTTDTAVKKFLFLYAQIMADNVAGVDAVAAVMAAAQEAQRERCHAAARHADDDARDGHRTCVQRECCSRMLGKRRPWESMDARPRRREGEIADNLSAAWAPCLSKSLTQGTPSSGKPGP